MNTWMLEFEKSKYRSEITRYRTKMAGKMKGKVLDVCGGIGTYIPYFSSDDVTILDINEDALKYAECNNKVVGDALHMPFNDNEFDSIWACACCYFFDFDDFIKEATRVGKPGGILVVEMANPNTPFDFAKKLLHMKTWGDYYIEYEYFHMLTPKELMRYGKVTGEVRFLPKLLDDAIRNIPAFWHTMLLEMIIEK